MHRTNRISRALQRAAGAAAVLAAGTASSWALECTFERTVRCDAEACRVQSPDGSPTVVHIDVPSRTMVAIFRKDISIGTMETFEIDGVALAAAARFGISLRDGQPAGPGNPGVVVAMRIDLAAMTFEMISGEEYVSGTCSEG